MNEFPSNENDFDAFLRKNLAASADYVPDDGFAARVCARLPERKRVQMAPVIAGVLMVVVVALMVPWLAIAAEVATYTLSLNSVMLLKLAAVVSGLMLVATGLVLARETRLL